jgi:hypothetical protein
MKLIESKLTKKSIERSKKETRTWLIPLTIIVGFNAVTGPYYYYVVYKNVEMNFVGVSSLLMTIYASFGTEYTVFLLEFMFMDFSVHVCLLLKQIEDDLEGIKFIYDEKRIKESFSEICEFHNEIQKITAELLNCFEDVFKVTVLTDIWMMGQAGMLLLDKLFLDLLMQEHFLLFEMWIYCYGAQKIISKVRKCMMFVSFDE